MMDGQSPYGMALQCPTAEHSSGAQSNSGKMVQEGQVFLPHLKKLGPLTIPPALERVLLLFPLSFDLPVIPMAKLCVKSG